MTNTALAARRAASSFVTLITLAAGLAAIAAPALAAAVPSIVQQDAIHWAPAEGFPPGAQIATLHGDITKEGPFTIRFKFPAGYVIPLHSHPTDEFITILSGNAHMAFGQAASPATALPMDGGAFMSLPAGAVHALWVDTDTVLEINSTGPFMINMVSMK